MQECSLPTPLSPVAIPTFSAPHWASPGASCTGAHPWKECSISTSYIAGRVTTRGLKGRPARPITRRLAVSKVCPSRSGRRTAHGESSLFAANGTTTQQQTLPIPAAPASTYLASSACQHTNTQPTRTEQEAHEHFPDVLSWRALRFLPLPPTALPLHPQHRTHYDTKTAAMQPLSPPADTVASIPAQFHTARECRVASRPCAAALTTSIWGPTYDNKCTKL